MDRRDAIKAGLGLLGGAVAAANVGDKADLREIDPEELRLQPGDWPDYNRDIALKILRFGRELGEIQYVPETNFETQTGASLLDSYDPHVVDVPLATLPRDAIYARWRFLDRGLADQVKPPVIDSLLFLCRRDSPDAAPKLHRTITAVVRALWGELFPHDRWESVNAESEVTARASAQDKCRKERLLTPRYIIDVEELDNSRLALMLLQPVVDILRELHTKVGIAWRTWEDGTRAIFAPAAPGVEFVQVPLGCLPLTVQAVKHAQRGPFRSRVQVSLPQVYLRREAFMLEMFTYVMTAGVIAQEFAED